jgi:Leucine-rich repeat (LRR) protein
MKLPNLKGLWLNDNPVVSTCNNFTVIGDHFDKLEIINSDLTAKAGEWAMLFYAKDTGAKTLEEITKLDLSGKNLLLCNDLSFVGQMKNLKELDISGNLDMYMPMEMR